MINRNLASFTLAAALAAENGHHAAAERGARVVGPAHGHRQAGAQLHRRMGQLNAVHPARHDQVGEQEVDAAARRHL